MFSVTLAFLLGFSSEVVSDTLRFLFGIFSTYSDAGTYMEMSIVFFCFVSESDSLSFLTIFHFAVSTIGFKGNSLVIDQAIAGCVCSVIC